MRTFLAGLMLLGPVASGSASSELDPVSVQRTGRPNDFLVCAEGACAAPADAPAPVFVAPAEAVLDAWMTVIEQAERTRIVAADRGQRTARAEQKSALFGFVDSIAVRVLELPDGRTSFAAYSRSETGYWDLGVNRRRLLAWTAAVEQRVRGP